MNFFENLPDCSAAEVFETLLAKDGLRIERIVSAGQSTPPDQWLKQDKEEWVILLQGRAGFCFEGMKSRVLNPGDYLRIPPDTRHRVTWTDPEQITVWLAVHF